MTKDTAAFTADIPHTDDTPVVPHQYRVYFFLLVSCFALWGLLNNMTDNLVPSFAKIFMIKGIADKMKSVRLA